MQLDWTLNVFTVASGMIAGGLMVLAVQRAVMKVLHEFDIRVVQVERAAARLAEETQKKHDENREWQTRFEDRMLQLVADVARLGGQVT